MDTYDGILFDDTMESTDIDNIENESIESEGTATESSSSVKIWAPIVAVLGAIIIGLLAFIVVRHCKRNEQINARSNPARVPAPPDYEAPYAFSQYELPYGNPVQNENDVGEVYEEYHSATEYETYRET